LLLIFATSSIFAEVWQWSVTVNKYISSETNDHQRVFCGSRRIVNKFGQSLWVMITFKIEIMLQI